MVHEERAEIVARAPVTGRLYADCSATGGALSRQRIMLAGGAGLRSGPDMVQGIGFALVRQAHLSLGEQNG